MFKVMNTENLFLLCTETNLTNTIFNLLSNLPNIVPNSHEQFRIPTNHPLTPTFQKPMYLCPKLPIQPISPPSLPNKRLDSYIGLVSNFYLFQVFQVIVDKFANVNSFTRFVQSFYSILRSEWNVICSNAFW